MPTEGRPGWMWRPETPESPWQPGWIPYCGQPPRERLEENDITFDQQYQRWFWVNNSNPKIPQDVRDKINAGIDPCPPVRTDPQDTGDAVSPPPPPALPSDTPTEFARIYNEVCAELNRIADEAQTVTDALQTDVAADLGASEAAANTVTDELAGSIDNAMRDSFLPLARMVDRLANDVQRALTMNSGDLQNAGADIPYNPMAMGQALQGDWLTMLGNAFPAIGAALGQQQGQQVPGMGMPAQVGAPQLAPGLGGPAPGMPAQAAAQEGQLAQAPGGVLSADELLEMGYGPAMEGPRPEPVLPVQGQVSPIVNDRLTPYLPDGPRPGSSTSSTSPTAAECCPDVHVTVNVPPITLPAGLTVSPAPVGPPPPPPPPALPPAGTPYPGTPSRSEIVDGRVTYSIDARSWVYAAPPAAEPAPVYLNVSVPTSPTPSPPAAPVPGEQPSSLLYPITTGGIGPSGKWLPDWSSPTACVTMTGIVERLTPQQMTATGSSTASAAKSWLGSQFGMTPDITDRLFGPGQETQLQAFVNKAVDGAALSFDVFTGFVTRAILPHQVATILGDSTSNAAAATYYGTRLGAALAIEDKTKFPLGYLFTGVNYSFQWSNPQYLPTQIQINDAFLRGHISEMEWECWTRCNGNLPEPFRKVMLADQLKPNMGDLIELYRRGHNTLSNLKQRARELGVLNPLYVDEWLAVTKQLPTQSDLIRFMVRDSADDTVSEKYGYDTDFTAKYTDQIKGWANALGLDETYFRYSWRAHWDIPSYTQLTEMIARLRPDRLEVKQWAEKYDPSGKGEVELGAPPRPRTVTRDDVRKALQVNDMAPGWVEPLIDISYTPINRTDAIRAYNTGAFTEEQLRDAFLNVRYSERDADIMVAFYKRDKERRLRNVTGSWSPRKVTQHYKQHLLSYDEAYKLLEQVLPSTKLVEQTLEEAELDMEAAERRVIIATLKRQYMLGEHSDGAVKGLLSNGGIDGIHVNRLVAIWKLERDGRRKIPTVAMLSKWLKNQIISVEEGRMRLVNLGYSLIDADRIIAAAMSFQYEDGPPSAEELSGAVSEAIKNQQTARRAAGGTLANRLSQIVREASRIYREMVRRAAHAGQPPPPAPTIPGAP